MTTILFLLSAGGALPASYMGLCEEAVKHLEAGRPLWAVSLLSAAKERRPEEPLAWALSAASWALAGKWEEASQHASRAISFSSSEPLAKFIEGLVRLKGGDFKGAEGAFEASWRKLPLKGRPLVLKALAHLLAGHTEKAFNVLKEAALEGENPQAKAVLAWALAKRGDWREAVEAAREAVDSEEAKLAEGKTESTQFDLTLRPSLSLKDLQPGWEIERGKKAVEALRRPSPLPLPKRLSLPEGLRIAPIQRDGTVQGRVSISGTPPPSSNRKTSFVAIKIDREVVYLSNSPPFEFLWDTRLAEDGKYKISFVSFARDGSLVGELTAEVEVRNQTEGPLDPEKVADLERAAIGALCSKAGFDRGALRELVVVGLRNLGQPEEALREAKALLSDRRKVSPWLRELAEKLEEEVERLKRKRKEEEIFQMTAVFTPSQNSRLVYPSKPKQQFETLGKLKVILIFDDGPYPKTTPAILDILDRYRIKATFFLTGSAVKRYPQLAREITRRGHEVGGHGYTGRRLHTFPDWEVEAEVTNTMKIIREVCGVDIRLFRPPGERMNETVREVIESKGLKIVPHDVGDWPYRNLPPRKAASKILGQVSEGKIVLLHNGPHVPVSLIEEVVKGLLHMGYQPVSVLEFERGRP